MRSLRSFVSAGLLAASLLLPSLASAQAPAQTGPTGLEPSTNVSFVDPRLLAVGAGAVVGIVAFNVLSAPLGIVPLAGGALEAVPYSVALGSRLIAGAAGAVGALAANYGYDLWTGTKSDYRYLVTLSVGALAGVAAGNYLALGTLGTPPYYVGSGAVDLAGTMASSAAQAASRVYVIGSAVLGAWVADYVYHR
jgi:hypothetical protein